MFRWQNLWPRAAQFFDMEVGLVHTVKLAQFMVDKGPMWDRIVQKYSLQLHRFEQIAAWPFDDFVFTPDYDIISDMGKARRHGFGGYVFKVVAGATRCENYSVARKTTQQATSPYARE